MRLLFTCLLFWGPFCLWAQNQNIITNRSYPQDYFQKPLNIAPQASGTFGELRSTHFHAGDDYRTQQRIGLPLHAAAEGYVTRVRVQIGGGGNALYIDHPNGFTTVYLHMDTFNDALSQIVKTEQYQQQRFDVDIMLEPHQVPLSKGQLIGRAGNTGSSQGPHLHFEIRDTKTQNPLNPQLFALHFPDNLAPIISSLMIYDLHDPVFNENTPRRRQTLQNTGRGRYTLAKNTIPVNGSFGIGISTIDRHNSTSFSHGVYSIELFVDEKSYSTILFEELDFENTRAIHSYIDYPNWIRNRTRVQKTFKDPNNPTNIFHKLRNRGIIEFNDDLPHDLKLVVKDVHGNSSEISFKVQNNPSFAIQGKANVGTKIFEYDNENHFEAENIRLKLEKDVLYDRIYFNYSQNSAPAGAYSLIQNVHNNLTPLFNSYSLAIRAKDLPARLEKKALIVSRQGGSQGGRFKDGWVHTNPRSFGSFYVTVDTIAPQITARNLPNGNNVAAQTKIDFTISDNLSGIQSFNGYINGEWVLMEYDSKNKHLWHTFDGSLPKGKHHFKLVVKDWKDNQKVFTADFIR